MENLYVGVTQYKNGFAEIYLSEDDVSDETVIDVRTTQCMYVKCNGNVVLIDFSTGETIVSIFKNK